MANIVFFADCCGDAQKLVGVYYPGNGRKPAGRCPLCSRLIDAGVRTIERKSNPSRHECDSRCLNASGRIMRCECQCGGKNHGRGSALVCAAA